MSVFANFLVHIVFVLLCIGLGYALRFSLEQFKELDEQVKRNGIKPGTPMVGCQPQPLPISPLPRTGSSGLKAKADPAKLAALQSSFKK
jgi:hypothetical protein